MAECTCADPMMVAKAINDADTNNIQSRANTISSEGPLDETLYGKGLTDSGTHGAPAPVRFCHWQAPEYGNKGENWWTMLFQAAAVAIAVANGIAQQEIADKQQDLADSWYQQAKYKWDRYAGTYIPLEKKLLNEVSSTPVPSLDCAGAESRAQQSVDSAYGEASDYMARQAKALRLCMDSSLLGYVNLKQNVALVDSRNYNYVDDRWFRDYKDDQRWNRRSNVLSLGRNLDSQALSYGQVANALYGQVGQQIDRAASGLVTALGYFGARNDTYYPTTYLGSGGSPSGQLVGINMPASINPTGISPSGD